MLAQPVLIGVWMRGLPRSRPVRPAPACVRPVGAGLLLALSGAGQLLAGTGRGTYLGWLLAWAGALLAVQWAFGGDLLWQRRRQLATAVLPPVLYLCAVDRLALHLRLWELSPTLTTGLAPLGMPVEEAVFFLLTSTLVAMGLALATDRAVLVRLPWRRLALHRVWSAGVAERPALPARREVVRGGAGV